MNKDYKGALFYLMNETYEYNGGKIIPKAQNAIDDLKELVERNEPMKVRFRKYPDDNRYDCPNCGCYLGFEANQPPYPSLLLRCGFCPLCGQKLDWEKQLSKEERDRL